MKNCALLALALVPILAQGQLDTKIDYVSPGKSMADVLKDLSQLSRLQFTADEDLDDFVVVAHVKQMTVQDFARYLEQASGGDWVLADGKYKLSVTSSAMDRAVDAYFAHLKTVFGEAVKKIPLYDTYSSSYSATDQVKAAVNGQSPEKGSIQFNPLHNAIGLILKEVEFNDLKLLPYRRKVYSTAPTSTQEKMPSRMKDIVNRAANDYVSMLKAAAAAPEQSRKLPGNLRSERWLQREMERNIVKANVVIYRGETDYSIQIQLINDQGEIASDSNLGINLNLRLTQPDWQGVSIQLPPDFQLSPAGLIALDHLGRGMKSEIQVETENGSAQFPFRRDVDSSALPQLLDPDQFDPVALTVGDLLANSQYAKGQLVAVIPDEIIVGAPSNLKNLVIFLNQQTAWTLDTKSGVNLIAPYDHYLSWKKMVDRKALAKVISDAQENYGFLSLDAKCDYALATPEFALQNTWDRAYFEALFASNKSQSLSEIREARYSYEVYNSAGKPVQNLRYALLGVPAKDALDYHVFNSRQDLQRITRPNRFAASGGTNEFMVVGSLTIAVSEEPSRNGNDSFDIQRWGGNGRMERTDKLPYGLPSDGSYTCINNSSSQFFALDNSRGTGRMFSSGSYAYTKAAANYPTPGRPTENVDRYSEFLLVEMDVIVMQLQPTNDTQSSLVVMGYRVVGKPGSFNDLPDKLKQEIQQQYARAERSAIERLTRGNNGRGRSNRGGGGTIPPAE